MSANHAKNPWRSHRPLALWIVALLLSACGPRPETTGDSAKAATQVAARVNGREITVHQINALLMRMSSVSSMQSEPGDALSALIDQELAVEQALNNELDRRPAVMAAIEAARRDILARAYFEQVTSSLPQPDAREIREYHQDHPALFAERRLYSLKEFSFPATAATVTELRRMTGEGRAFDEIAAWLKENGIAVQPVTAVRAPEQLPIDMLPELSRTPHGGMVVFHSPAGAYVAQVLGSQAAPVAESEALKKIARFLENQRLRQAIAETRQQLRAEAEIEYLGEFSETASSRGSSDVARTDTGSGNSAVSGNHPVQSTEIERGVAGLK